MSRVTVNWDKGELIQLEHDLTRAPGRIQRSAHETLKQGARLVNTGMKRDASGHRFLPRLPKSVSWEMLDQWTAEIGLSPIPGTQGRLAHIIVYGSINNAPVYDYTAALRRSQPAIDKMFGDTGEDAVLGVKQA